jgi:hypothetical protein
MPKSALTLIRRTSCGFHRLSILAAFFSGLGVAGVHAEISPEIHEKCLKASDYTGCVEVQVNGVRTSESTEEMCDASGHCLAKKGEDRLGLPKVEGWKYRVYPDGTVMYVEIQSPTVIEGGEFKSKFYQIPHKGQRRYVGRRMVIHWYDHGAAATSGHTISSGGGSTTCNSYGTSIQCNTTPGINTYIPGSAGRPAGPRSVSSLQVADCRDGTWAQYENGTRLRGDWKKIPGELPWACNEMDTLPVLQIRL